MFVLLGCPKEQTHLSPTLRVAIVGRSLFPTHFGYVLYNYRIILELGRKEITFGESQNPSFL